MDLSMCISFVLPFLRVQVNEGILEGALTPNPYGCPFYSFKGIPYAEPPVGDLRFKPPQPVKPWEEVRTATKFGSHCFSYNGFTNKTLPPTSGSEDCLYLNVYTPNVGPHEPLPVMVYIHGGGFTSGSGDDDSCAPEFLVRKNVILVTINYRLEILGFLSLDTEDIPGNAGMKDQVAALKWVKHNIHNFGGDANKITIFGNSAGGVSVSFHLVSLMSKDLFNRAITQSGTITSWLPHTFNARDRALLLARELGCDSTNDEEIYNFFKSLPVKKLGRSRIPVSLEQAVTETPHVYFGIVQEKDFDNNEKFYFGHPFDVLRNGIHEGVEVMNGYTEDEGILYFSTGGDSEKILKQSNDFLKKFVPEPYNTETSLANQMVIGAEFKKYYMKNKTVSKETLDDFLKYLNMETFVYGSISQAKIIAAKNKNKSYLYKFTCKSELNRFVNYTGIYELFDYRPVVAHSDELGYLFKSDDVDMKSETFKMIERTTTLWTNFAKYGDPTPDDSLGVKWLPFTLKDEDYLDIGNEHIPRQHPEKEEFEFWAKKFSLYLPKFVP